MNYHIELRCALQLGVRLINGLRRKELAAAVNDASIVGSRQGKLHQKARSLLGAVQTPFLGQKPFYLH